MTLSPILKKLMFVRQFEIDQGKIKVLGDREIMIHASAILELQNMDETKLYDIAKEAGKANISGAVEHAKVYGKMKDVFISEIAELGKKIGETDEGTLKTLQQLFDIYGLGQMAIEDINNKDKTAIIMVKDSSLADEFLEKKKSKSKTAVCTLTSGVIAGMFSYIFGKEVDCVEEKCKAKGEGNCLFNVG